MTFTFTNGCCCSYETANTHGNLSKNVLLKKHSTFFHPRSVSLVPHFLLPRVQVFTGNLRLDFRRHNSRTSHIPNLYLCTPFCSNKSNTHTWPVRHLTVIYIENLNGHMYVKTAGYMYIQCTLHSSGHRRPEWEYVPFIPRH